MGNLFSVKDYIKDRKPYRNRYFLESVSSTINSEIKESFQRNKRPIIYLDKKITNPYIYPYSVLEWGFASNRYSLLNKRTDIVPIMSDMPYEEFLKEVSDPLFITKHELVKLEIDNFYAFEVSPNGVISRTSNIRSDLKNFID